MCHGFAWDSVALRGQASKHSRKPGLAMGEPWKPKNAALCSPAQCTPHSLPPRRTRVEHVVYQLASSGGARITVTVSPCIHPSLGFARSFIITSPPFPKPQATFRPAAMATPSTDAEAAAAAAAAADAAAAAAEEALDAEIMQVCVMCVG
jgi:hypothetical protein